MRPLTFLAFLAAASLSLSFACGPAPQAREEGAPSDDTAELAEVSDDDESPDDLEDLGDGRDEEEVEGAVEEGAILEELVVDASGDAEPDEIVLDDAADGVGGAAAARSAVTKTFRVLHWNIAGGKENACQTRGITRAVVRYVREHDVDFVGLNEVCPSQYRSIQDALRRHWGKPRDAVISAFVGDGTNRIVGNAIFSKRRFDVVSQQKLGQDRYGERWLLCGRVAVRKHLRFCSAHLTPGDATARRQLAKVHDRIERWWHERNDTVILSGDLNITPDDRALNEWYAAEASTRNNPNNRGRYRELDDDDRDHCRGYGERSHAGNGGPCREGGKIDFIFARANRIAGDYSADSLAVPNDCTGRCSDHRAIVGTAPLRIRIE